MYRHMELLVMD